MIDTTAPASTVSYSIVGCRESGRIMVERLLGRHRGAGPGRVVHVIRDGRDAAVAAWDALPPGHGLPLEEYVASFAIHWVSFIENVREAAQGHDGRYLELRYEALIGDRAAAISELLEFLRIDASPDTVRGCMERMSLDACDADTPGNWRYRFDGDAAFRFDAVAGYLLQQLGYAEPTSTGLRRAA